jgi:hypothetical protein
MGAARAQPRAQAVDWVGSRWSGGTFWSESAALPTLRVYVALHRLKSARPLARLLRLQRHEAVSDQGRWSEASAAAVRLVTPSLR